MPPLTVPERIAALRLVSKSLDAHTTKLDEVDEHFTELVRVLRRRTLLLAAALVLLAAAVIALVVATLLLAGVARSDRDLLHRVKAQTGPEAKARSDAAVQQIKDDVDVRFRRALDDLAASQARANGTPIPAPIATTSTTTTSPPGPSQPPTTLRRRSPGASTTTAPRPTTTTAAPPPSTTTTTRPSPPTSPPTTRPCTLPLGQACVVR